MIDFFVVFNLPRQLTLEDKELTQRYRTLSWEWHPDRRPKEEQAQGMAQTALLNEAYRSLRDPFARAQHLLTLEGWTLPTTPPQSLLIEVFEVQELLEEESTPLHLLQEQYTGWQQRFSELRIDLDRAFRRWDQGEREALVDLQNILLQRTYLATILEKLALRIK